MTAGALLLSRLQFVWVIAWHILLPAFTAGHWLNEILFCRKWSEMLEGGNQRLRMLGNVNSKLEVNLAG